MTESVRPSYPRTRNASEAEFPYADIPRDGRTGRAHQWIHGLWIEKGKFRATRGVTQAVNTTMDANRSQLNPDALNTYIQLRDVAKTWDHDTGGRKDSKVAQLALDTSYAVILESGLFAPAESGFDDDITEFRNMNDEAVRTFGRSAWASMQASHQDVHTIYQQLNRILTDARKRPEKHLPDNMRDDITARQRAGLMLPYVIKVHDVLRQDTPEFVGVRRYARSTEPPDKWLV